MGVLLDQIDHAKHTVDMLATQTQAQISGQITFVTPEDSVEYVRRLERFKEEYEAESLTRVMDHIKQRLCVVLPGWIGKRLAEEARSPEIKTSSEKQRIAKHYNALVAQYGLTFAHPDTKEPCNLVAISDVWGGKFTLENKKTKKRTHGTKDHTKIPIVLIPLPLPHIVRLEDIA